MRATILLLEGDLRDMKRDSQSHRRQMVMVQRSIIDGQIQDARRALAELLATWPLN